MISINGKLAFLLMIFIAVNATAQKLPSKYEQQHFLSWYFGYSKSTSVSTDLIEISGGHGFNSHWYSTAKDFHLSKADHKYIKRQILPNKATLKLDTNRFANVAWKRDTLKTSLTQKQV